MHKNHGASPSSNGPGYETQDVKGKLVFWSLAVLTVITIACVFVAAWMFVEFQQKLPSTAKAVPSLTGTDRVLPPEPRLQAIPPLDLAKYQAEQKEATTSYGWVDKTSQKIHIPIELAIDLTAQRGLLHIKPGDPLPVVTPPPSKATAPSAIALTPQPAAAPSAGTP